MKLLIRREIEWGDPPPRRLMGGEFFEPSSWSDLALLLDGAAEIAESSPQPVPGLWEFSADQWLLDECRKVGEALNKLLPDPEARKAALDKLTEYRQLFHVYESNAIEGSSLSHEETVTVVKNGITVGGKPMRDHLAAIGLNEAIDDVKEICFKPVPIDNSMIRKLHFLILKGQDDKAPGEFRKEQVIITGARHIPPEAIRVIPLMEEFEAELGRSFNSGDPIPLAAAVHGHIATIHPFMDGNGRVARLLANLVLLRRGYPFVNIEAVRRPYYLSAMAEANENRLDLLLGYYLWSVGGSLDLLKRFEEERRSYKQAFSATDRNVAQEAKVFIENVNRNKSLILVYFQSLDTAVEEMNKNIAPLRLVVSYPTDWRGQIESGAIVEIGIGCRLEGRGFGRRIVIAEIDPALLKETKANYQSKLPVIYLEGHHDLWLKWRCSEGEVSQSKYYSRVGRPGGVETILLPQGDTAVGLIVLRWDKSKPNKYQFESSLGEKKISDVWISYLKTTRDEASSKLLPGPR